MDFLHRSLMAFLFRCGRFLIVACCCCCCCCCSLFAVCSRGAHNTANILRVGAGVGEQRHHAQVPPSASFVDVPLSSRRGRCRCVFLLVFGPANSAFFSRSLKSFSRQQQQQQRQRRQRQRRRRRRRRRRWRRRQQQKHQQTMTTTTRTTTTNDDDDNNNNNTKTGVRHGARGHAVRDQGRHDPRQPLLLGPLLSRASCARFPRFQAGHPH